MKTKLTKKETTEILCWCATLTDEELKKEYYRLSYESLGTETDRMYELGYDIAAIKEQEYWERYTSLKSDLLEDICHERGLKLWNDEKDGDK